MVTGEELYTRWVQKLEARNVGADAFEDLDETDQGAWNDLAEAMYMTREAAVELLKEAAVMYPGQHEYLKDAKEDPNWMPHEWAIQAVLRGANGAFEA